MAPPMGISLLTLGPGVVAGVVAEPEELTVLVLDPLVGVEPGAGMATTPLTTARATRARDAIVLDEGRLD